MKESFFHNYLVHYHVTCQIKLASEFNTLDAIWILKKKDLTKYDVFWHEKRFWIITQTFLVSFNILDIVVKNSDFECDEVLVIKILIKDAKLIHVI